MLCLRAGCHTKEGKDVFTAAPDSRTRSNASSLVLVRYKAGDGKSLVDRKNFLTVTVVGQK